MVIPPRLPSISIQLPSIGQGIVKQPGKSEKQPIIVTEDPAAQRQVHGRQLNAAAQEADVVLEVNPLLLFQQLAAPLGPVVDIEPHRRIPFREAVASISSSD